MARDDQERIRDGNKGNLGSTRVVAATPGIGRASLDEDDVEDEIDEADDGVKVRGDDILLS